MPAKLLVVNVTRGSTTKSVGSYPVAWNYTLTVTPQPHSDVVTDPDRFYDGRDVKVGDYFTTTNGGRALQITSISSSNSNSVTCVAEDINQINGKLDPNQGYESEIPNGVGILFEVVNGLPVIYPLPDALPGTFDKTFSVQLLNRFESLKPAVTLPNNVLTTDNYDVANGVPRLDGLGKLDISKLANLTKAAVGLGNVDNTSDLNKPISTLTQTALNSKISTSLINVANGVAGLDANGMIPGDKIPGSIIVTVADYSNLPATGESGKLYVVTSQNKIYVWTGSTYADITSAGGSSGTDGSYEYIAVGVDTTLSNKQVVSLLDDDLVLTLPPDPVNGYEVIILNSSSYSFTLTTGEVSPKPTINGSIQNFVETGRPNLYLVYVNDWKVSDSTQSVNINTAAETKSSDSYWPANTVHEVTEELVYIDKQAFIETWKNSTGSILAQQVTIFDDYANFDHYRQIWYPREGVSLEKRVVFTPLSMIDLPAVSYYGNLVFSLTRLLNINWRDYQTLEELMRVPANFFNIIDNQPVIDIITSNADFLHQFVESVQDRRTFLPIQPMLSNTTPTGKGTILTAVSDTTYATNAWKMFDADPLTYWESVVGQVTNQSVAYEIGGGYGTIFPHTINITTSDPEKCPKHIKVQHLLGTTWVDAGEFILDNSQTEHEFKLTTAGITDNSWRFLFIDNWGGNTIRVNNIKLTGWNTSLFV